MRPFLLLLCAGLPLLAQAQEEPAVQAIHPEVSEVIFDGPLEIEGRLIGPDGSVLHERARAVFGPLFELRTDFRVEMAESVNEVR